MSVAYFHYALSSAIEIDYLIYGPLFLLIMRIPIQIRYNIQTRLE